MLKGKGWVTRTPLVEAPKKCVNELPGVGGREGNVPVFPGIGSGEDAR